MSAVQHLKGCEIFAGLGERQIKTLAGISQVVKVDEGTRIFGQDEVATHFYSVGRGSVSLEMTVPGRGGPTMPARIAVVGPGDAFGWSAIVEPYVMTLTAKAAEPSELLMVESATLRKLLETDREINSVVMSNLVKLLAIRLAQTREALIYERGWALVG